MKYFCSISFGLHDVDIDAHDFYKWTKKEEENSTIKFLFLSIDDYEDCSPSYHEHASNYICRWFDEAT